MAWCGIERFRASRGVVSHSSLRLEITLRNVVHSFSRQDVVNNSQAL